MITFLDQNDVEYGALATIKATNAVNGERSISGDIVYGDYVLSHIERGWRVRFNDEYYAITYAKPVDEGNQVSVSFDAVHQFFWDFDKSSVHSQLSDSSHTFQAYLEFIFKDSGYRYTVDSGVKVNAIEKQSFGYKKRLTLFNDIIKSAGLEFQVNGKVVKIVEKIGTDLSTVVRKNFNLNDLGIEKNISDFVTYQKGFGAWNDSEDHSKGRLEVAYESPLAAVYGRLEAEPVTDERYTNKDSLLEVLKTNVDNSYTISVKLDIEDLTRAGYSYTQPVAGDYIMAINETIGFQEKIRIVSFTSEYDVKGQLISHEVTCNDIGSVKKQEASYNLTQKQAANASDEAIKAYELANTALVSADGKNTVYYGTEYPLDSPKGTLKTDDLLFLTVGDVVKQYRWNGTEWVYVTGEDYAKNLADDLKSEVDTVTQQMQANDAARQKEIATVLSKANANTDLAQEAKNLGTQAKNDAASALARANQVKDEAIAEAKRLASEQKTSITSDIATAKGQAITEAGKLIETAKSLLSGQILGISTDLTKTKEAIELLATRATVDALTGRVSSAEASLKVQADQISQRVKTSDFDKATQRLTSAESSITQLGNRITTEISEVEAQIPTSVGNENLILEGDRQVSGIYWGNSTLLAHSFYYNGQKKLFQLNTASSGEITSGSNRFKVKRNQKYSLSFWTFSSSNMKSFDVWYLGRKSGETAGFTVTNLIINSHSNSPSKAEYVTVTFNSGETDEGYIRFDNNGSSNGSNAIFAFGEVMLVEGNIASAYRPSTSEMMTEISSVKTTIAQTAEGVTQLSTRLTQSDSKLSQQETQIKQLVGEVGSKVSQTDYDSLKGTVNSQATQIKQVSDSIALKADKTITDSLTQQITQTKADLEITSDAVRTKVSQTDFNAATKRLSSAETSITTLAGQITTKLSRTEVDKLVTDKGYQTKADVDSNIKGRDLVTTTVLTNSIQESELGTIQRISQVETTLTGQINTKIQTVQDTVDSHTRTIADQAKSISQVIQTAEGLVTRIAKLNDENNLVYDPTKMSLYKARSTASNITKTGVGVYELLRITASGLTANAWTGFQVPLRTSKFTKGDTFSYRVNVWVDVLPDDILGFEIKNGSTIIASWSINLTKTGSAQIFTGTFTIQNSVTTTDDYALHVWLRKNGTVAIGQLQIVRGDVVPSTFYDSTTTQEVATQTIVSQLQGSWAVQNLTSSGTILNQLNLNKDGSVKIDGKLIQITGTTYIQDGVITSAKIATLDAAKITTGTLNAANVNVVNMNASNITSGTMSANLISGGILKSLNGSLQFDLNNSVLNSYSNNSTIRRVTDNQSQFLRMSYESNITYTTIGANRKANDEAIGKADFTGIRIASRSVDKGGLVDTIDIFGDSIFLWGGGGSRDGIMFKNAQYFAPMTNGMITIGAPGYKFANAYFKDINVGGYSLVYLLNWMNGVAQHVSGASYFPAGFAAQ